MQESLATINAQKTALHKLEELLRSLNASAIAEAA
jgi:hypothetical protein